MDSNTTGFLLVGMFVSTVSMALLTYLGNRVTRFLETAKQQPGTIRRRLFSGQTGGAISRRRVVLFPGIVCSLPIHQHGRMEAPLSGK
jgi:hypothetical protein